MIVNNAGLEGAVVVEKVKSSPKGVGFDVLTEEYVDMVERALSTRPWSPEAPCRMLLPSAP